MVAVTVWIWSSTKSSSSWLTTIKFIAIAVRLHRHANSIDYIIWIVAMKWMCVKWMRYAISFTQHINLCGLTISRDVLYNPQSQCQTRWIESATFLSKSIQPLHCVHLIRFLLQKPHRIQKKADNTRTFQRNHFLIVMFWCECITFKEILEQRARNMYWMIRFNPPQSIVASNRTKFPFLRGSYNLLQTFHSFFQTMHELIWFKKNKKKRNQKLQHTLRSKNIKRPPECFDAFIVTEIK